MEKQNVQKRLPGNDPLWAADFLFLRKISKTAFILWRLYISLRNLNTNVCDLSDYKAQLITGFNRKTIKTARDQLIQAGHISPHGYHAFLVNQFERFSTDSPENTLLEQILQRKKYPTGSVKNTLQLGKNYATVDQKLPHPINTYSNTDNTNRKDSASPVENSIKIDRIDESELPSLRSLYPFEDREGLKRHLMATRNFTEKQVSDTFERVYPVEYTGKAR